MALYIPIIAVFVVMVLLALRRGGAESVPVAPAVPPDLNAVRAAIAEGRMIDAIKLYREMTGAGLAASKDAVERLARGETVAAPARPPANAEADAQVLQAIRARNLIDAIRIYREAYRTDLKTAKEAVEKIAASL